MRPLVSFAAFAAAAALVAGASCRGANDSDLFTRSPLPGGSLPDSGGGITPASDGGSDAPDADPDGGAIRCGAAERCPAGLYCLAPGCDAGTCVPSGDAAGALDLVCGCDGVTHWNPVVAARRGVAVQGGGACGDGGVPCGDGVATPCPDGTRCSFEAPVAAACGATPLPGTCLALPKACTDGYAIGPPRRLCSAPIGPCQPLCFAILDGGAYYTDPGCN